MLKTLVVSVDLMLAVRDHVPRCLRRLSQTLEIIPGASASPWLPSLQHERENEVELSTDLICSMCKVEFLD